MTTLPSVFSTEESPRSDKAQTRVSVVSNTSTRYSKVTRPRPGQSVVARPRPRQSVAETNYLALRRNYNSNKARQYSSTTPQPSTPGGEKRFNDLCSCFILFMKTYLYENRKKIDYLYKIQMICQEIDITLFPQPQNRKGVLRMRSAP